MDLWVFVLFFFKTSFIYFFREKGREGEKHQYVRDTWLPLAHPYLWTWLATQAMCSDWDSNQ